MSVSSESVGEIPALAVEVWRTTPDVGVAPGWEDPGGRTRLGAKCRR